MLQLRRQLRFSFAGKLLSSAAAVLLASGCASTMQNDNGVTNTSATVAETALVQFGSDNQPFTSVDNFSVVFNIFKQAKVLVENETATKLHDVSLEIVSDDVIQNQVRHETRKLVNSQFPNASYAAHFLNKMVGEQSGSYAALYTDNGNRILISRPLLLTFLNIASQNEVDANQAVAALLIHELVHAADDQRYKIHKNRQLNFKASFTQSAAFEGHAQLVTRRLCKRHNCLPGMYALQQFMFAPSNETDPVAQSVQAVSRNILEYSYIEGERFLSALSQRADGEQLIADVLLDPPQDPIQILVPETYPDQERYRRNAKLKNAIAFAPHPWTSYPWAVVQTSPIKGIDLRDDPKRREAAIEGFTRLITAMESAQIYDQSDTEARAIDVTLIQADSIDTAYMFVQSFAQHSRSGSEHGELSSEQFTIPLNAAASPAAMELIYLSSSTAARQGDDTSVVIAIADRYVLQLSGASHYKKQNWLSFARSIMQAL